MAATAPEVTVTVSQPYQVVGAHGRTYPGERRDYTATVLGCDIKQTSKDEIKRIIRAKYYRETGSNRVRFTFTDSQEG